MKTKLNKITRINWKKLDLLTKTNLYEWEWQTTIHHQLEISIRFLRWQTPDQYFLTVNIKKGKYLVSHKSFKNINHMRQFYNKLTITKTTQTVYKIQKPKKVCNNEL